MPRIDVPEGNWISLGLLKRKYPELIIEFPKDEKGNFTYFENTELIRTDQGAPDYIVRVLLSMLDNDAKYTVLLPFWSMGGRPNVTECTLMETLFRWRNSGEQDTGRRPQHEQSDRPS